MTLDPEFKAKWIAALRSGEYKQGKDCLRNGLDEYCCLGVLAEVLELPMEPISSGEHCAISCYQLVGEGHPDPDIFLPSSIIPRQLQGLLANMNDGTGDNGVYTFNQIADYIEREL